MAITATANLYTTAAGALWNQWTNVGMSYATTQGSSNKQSFAFTDPSTVLPSDATITSVVLNAGWTASAAGLGLTICGVYPDLTITNTATNISMTSGSQTSTVTLTGPSGGWTIANLGTIEIQLLENSGGAVSTETISTSIGDSWLAVTYTTSTSPGTESEQIILIL